MTSTPPPIHYLLPLYPGFQLLDVAGPLDILNLLSLTHPACSALTLTIIGTTLDPIPTKPIPPLDPTTHTPKWSFPDFPTLSNSINTAFSQSITPTATFSSYLAALDSGSLTRSGSSDGTIPPIDVLLIPGGVGSRIHRTFTGENPGTQLNVADLLAFIPRIAPYVRHAIVTVCTGSDILARTGLLDGRRATTNMSRFDEVSARSKGVSWLRGRRWVRSLPAEGDESTFTGEIWSSAGISAGIDVTFAFVAEHYGGIGVAREAAKKLEYEWREIAEGVVDPMYGLNEDGEEVGGKVVG